MLTFSVHVPMTVMVCGPVTSSVAIAALMEVNVAGAPVQSTVTLVAWRAVGTNRERTSSADAHDSPFLDLGLGRILCRAGREAMAPGYHDFMPDAIASRPAARSTPPARECQKGGIMRIRSSRMTDPGVTFRRQDLGYAGGSVLTAPACAAVAWCGDRR